MFACCPLMKPGNQVNPMKRRKTPEEILAGLDASDNEAKVLAAEAFKKGDAQGLWLMGALQRENARTRAKCLAVIERERK